MSSPTQRSLALLRRQGWTCQVVEKWIPQALRRVDLFGFCDIVFLNGKIVALQVTSASNQSARIKKIKADPRALEWLKSGGRIFVHGWSKKKLKRGGKAKRWTCKETEIFAYDIETVF